MLIRVDLVFTYWIYAWYLAYIAKLTIYNPKWALVVGIVDNILLAIALLLYGAKISSIAFFLLVNVILKGIPLYTIYNTKTTKTDIYALLVYFAIYTLWVHVNGGTVAEYLQKIFESILHEKNETPGMWALTKLYQIYNKIDSK